MREFRGLGAGRGGELGQGEQTWPFHWRNDLSVGGLRPSKPAKGSSAGLGLSLEEEQSTSAENAALYGQIRHVA